MSSPVTNPIEVVHSSNAHPLPVMPTPSASLYVGELDPTVTEAMLFEMFNMIGPVASIRVCRDAVTRRSLGYAYVNFQNVHDGERALESLNYSLVKGKPCRIMWSQRDPSLRKTGSGNIFIKNLDTTIDNKALHDTFSAFGNILSCKVAMDKENKSKGYGFVHYETKEAADAAIKHVNNMLLNDKKVYVGPHISRKERQAKIDEIRANFTNIFIKNLDTEVDDDEFRDMFAQYGKITSAVIQRDEEGKSRGFGFVNFEQHEDARVAVDELNGREINGKELFVARAQKKAEREEELKKQYEQAKLEKQAKYQGVNLYVKNLDDDMDDEKLRTEFSVYGDITSAKIMRNENGSSKGFGFVCFSAPDEATKAVAEMNGRMVGTKPIYVALAQRKEVRRSQLEAQMAAQRAQMQFQRPPFSAAQGYPPLHMPYTTSPGVFMYPGQRPMFQAGMMGRPPRPHPSQQRPFPGQGRQGGANSRSPRPDTTSNNPPAADAAPSTPSDLASQSPEQQKQILGERLYPLIHQEEPEYAGKITGMLLEMDRTELLGLLSDQGSLKSKIKEAMDVLKEHMEKEKATA